MIRLDNYFKIQNLRNKCEQSKSRIYGFILFTNRDPYIIKALRDDDFWNALDERSGPNWPVFSVRPIKKGQYANPEGCQESLQDLQSAWKEPNDNKEFLDFFGIESSKYLPCFVTFMWDDVGELHQFIVKIKSDSQENVYESLEKIIDTIAYAESKISDEFKRTEHIFREAVNDLKALQFTIRVRWFFNKFRIIELLSNLV